MADHSQSSIIHNHHFNWKVFSLYPLQFLNIHLEGTVTADAGGRFSGCIISSDRCRKSISHRSMSTGEKKLLAFMIFERLIAPYHVLPHIHCNSRSIFQHLTETGNHTVRITFRCLVIHCLKIFLDLITYIEPFPVLIRFLHCCPGKTVDHCSCFCLKFYFIGTIFMNVSL